VSVPKAIPSFPVPPPSGRRVEVSPRVWWVRMPLPFALDHINLWLLEGDSGYTIVDTGIALDSVRTAWEEVLSELDKPVTDIVVTHFHPDHLGLATWLAEKTGAPIHMSAGEFLTAHLVWQQLAGHGIPEMLRLFARHGLAEPPRAALAERGNAYRRGVPALPEEYRRLCAGDRLRFGPAEWHLHEGRGHSPEHIALYSPEARVLISGDMLLPRITSNISVFAAAPEEDALKRYLASLAAWKTLSDDVLILPSHGLPFRGASARIREIEDHHFERLGALESACSEPMTAAELLPTLFPRPLVDAHQTMFAMGEAIAHLNHLSGNGRLGRTCGADGVLRFQHRITINQGSFNVTNQ
jgi:glyoxylase-like metal-dependent hydrolase (beta-lactamase superfamily II)